MAVRTKQLASGRSTSSTATVVYTVPAGETAIVKAIDICNINGTTATEVVIACDAGAFNVTAYARIGLSALGFQHLERWLVLPPDAEISIHNSAAVNVNYWISGTELEGVAD